MLGRERTRARSLSAPASTRARPDGQFDARLSAAGNAILSRTLAPASESVPVQRDTGGNQDNAPGATVRRPVVRCTMGQGVVADLRSYVLASDNFSTCSAVILYNETTCRGGLYHFAAQNVTKGELSDYEQLNRLADMIGDVQPSFAVLDPRRKALPKEEANFRDEYEPEWRWAPGMSAPDVRYLWAWLSGAPNARVYSIHQFGQTSGNRYAIWADEQGLLNIDSEGPSDMGRTINVGTSHHPTNVPEGASVYASRKPFFGKFPTSW